MQKKKRKISPYIIIILCFLAPILLGTLLLCLPFSTTGEGSLSFVDALFLATSGVSTTGLSTVDLSQISIFGQIVVAVLVEIGGLSLLTIACFFILFVQKQLGYATQSLMKEALNRDTMADIKSLIWRIVQFSLCVQAIGATVNFIVLWIHFGTDEVGFALRASLFHAVSAYNNAGMDIFGYGDSLITLTADMSAALNVIFKINTLFMTITGGIGFIFIGEVWQKRNLKKLSPSTKIVFIMAFSLLFGGGLLLKLFSFLAERDVSLLDCVFLAGSAAGAGFDNVGAGSVSGAEYMVLLLLMYVGASPGSTGGGIKTTAVFVVVTAIFFSVRGKSPVFGHRHISRASVNKSFALIICSMAYIFLTVTVIAAIEGEASPIRDVVFNTVSAFSTTGFAAGDIAALSTASKSVLILTMFVGRVGVLTFLNAVNGNWTFTESGDKVHYVEENIIVG